MYPQPKKRLGQNFLTNPHALEMILRSCSLERSDIVLEIGPGRGVLTRKLAGRVKKVYAVELDAELSSLLKEEFKGAPRVTVTNGDFLKLDLAPIYRKHNRKLKIIGNIPYYISTPIIERLIACRKYFCVAYVMVQKEFGKRIIAPEGSRIYGSLSCFVQYYFTAAIMRVVGRNCFTPAPGVDSVFIRLEVRKKPAVSVGDEARFFKLIRQAFGQRRKTLKNNLKKIIPPEELSEFFARYSVREDARPEMLSLADFANLANIKKL